MKGNSILFSSIIKCVSGNISFMPKSGEKAMFANFIANRKDINPNGCFDVIAHGSSNVIEVNGVNKFLLIDARQAAKLIRRQIGYKKAKSIRLLSCNTGASPNGFAQHLANALGKPVYAPNMTIYSLFNGVHWVEDNGIKGEFIKFIPGGIKNGKK